ncbi:MAG TPA: ChaN family lipoprotein [Burkholderiaceae bacterium]|nr:ChaN family lipoprotein [Burkholderiaceae bacterium]HQR69620.1 ChaN family lipoprotein [Burkholderiaceae bacterium]
MHSAARTRLLNGLATRGAALLLALLSMAAAIAADVPAMPATSEDLAAAISLRRNVLLGEVHDNGVQHALRFEALNRVVAAGARPAIAFEQFDRERQPDIDRVRRERPGDVDALVALGARNWEWTYYRPFVQLAVEYGLPIVAANLSRADAIKVSTRGWAAVFDPTDEAILGLDHLPASFIAAHELAVAQGHCNLLPAESLSALARAQIARDIVLARALRPYLPGGVVLLTGNGHVRKDIGVPFWLTPEERRDLVVIALLESDAVANEGSADERRQRYDVVVETLAAERPDPCDALRRRLRAPSSK